MPNAEPLAPFASAARETPTGDTVLERFDTIAAARAAGWDEELPPPRFGSTSWLAAFGPLAEGGAGGPPTAAIRIRRGGVPVLQTTQQRLPVRGMRLGERIGTAWAAAALGAEAYQYGQALYSGPALATQLPPAETARALARLVRDGDREGTWFLKDLPAGTPAPAGWLPVPSLPEMAMALPTSWRDFDDYLAALPSKYRRRARRARGKLVGVEARMLTAAEADRFGESLTALYRGLIARTPYAPFVVEDGYISRLKRLRPADVALAGYFDGDRLVGFSTLLTDGDEALAHLAAVEPGYNRTHQLYLNLLFDLLATAIARRCRRLNLGRTATTIKSSLGAAPVPYASFVRHTGCLRHGILRQLVPRVFAASDAEALVQRPFGQPVDGPVG